MKKRLPKISIIVPTYNERENIKLLIDKIIKALKNYSLEIIVVDDDSEDKTWQAVEKIQKEKPLVHLYRRKKEKGLTSALNFGIERSSGEIIGWLDADLSHPPKYFAEMINYFPKYDVVIASRYVKGAADKRDSWLVILFSWLINKLAQILLSFQVTDYTSGFILVKKKLFQDFRLRGDYGEYFIDMAFHFQKKGWRIKEIPYFCLPRKFGQSKTASSIFVFFRKGIKYIWPIFSNFFTKFGKEK